ncbi:MAG: ABC transporter permease [Gordonia sp. (in: high G+C Gram-positive bacteria)]
MIRFALRSVAVGVAMFVTLTSATFVLVYASGVDIARNLLGDLATPAQVASKAAELGLDRPLPQRYIDWLGHAAVGDLGVSWSKSVSVSTLVLSRLPVTLSLVILVSVAAAVLATALGVIAAVRGGWSDRIVQAGSLLFSSIPGFVVGIVLVTLFAVRLRLFPATGFTPITHGIGPWLWSLILPATALILGMTATAAQQVRGALRDTLALPWVITLRSRGIAEWQVIWLHALRAAAPAGLAVFGLQFVGLLSGAVVLEQIFALPGIGTLAVSATSAGDLPLVMGVVVYSVLIVVVVTVLTDFLTGVLTPATRSRR